MGAWMKRKYIKEEKQAPISRNNIKEVIFRAQNIYKKW